LIIVILKFIQKVGVFSVLLVGYSCPRLGVQIDITIKTALIEEAFGAFGFDDPLKQWDASWSGNKLKKSLEKLHTMAQRYIEEIMLPALKSGLEDMTGCEIVVRSEGT
jgi:hypothetical protein